MCETGTAGSGPIYNLLLACYSVPNNNYNHNYSNYEYKDSYNSNNYYFQFLLFFYFTRLLQVSLEPPKVEDIMYSKNAGRFKCTAFKSASIFWVHDIFDFWWFQSNLE